MHEFWETTSDIEALRTALREQGQTVKVLLERNTELVLAAAGPPVVGLPAEPVKPWLEPRWLILQEMQRHRYESSKGAKPADPGWHTCSCGEWEGYWCDFQPHVAEQIDVALKHPRTPLDARRTAPEPPASPQPPEDR